MHEIEDQKIVRAHDKDTGENPGETSEGRMKPSERCNDGLEINPHKGPMSSPENENLICPFNTDVTMNIIFFHAMLRYNPVPSLAGSQLRAL